ncbi:putative ankyrin repeat protein [Phaeomoniella chlamydospora]|uniref:Putative ankyrin repeat protein n=1 Tax=Phaeomoniella chlamydospora TaxID=158046 RepID=A0A0G2F3B6_PHACM|nr:putative ankyrin repeat protein [Phaeomoniella chlamydospora]
MEQTHDDDLYLFDNSFGQAATPMTGQLFDDFLLSSPAKVPVDPSPACLNPSDLTVKQPTNGVSLGAYDPREHPVKLSGSPSGSSSSSSHGSSESPRYRERQMSFVSANSSQMKREENNQWSTGLQGLPMPAGEDFFADTDMSGLSTDGEYDSSNRQMASAFDFETASGTSNAFKSALSNSTKPTISPNGLVPTQDKIMLPGNNRVPAQFYFDASRETSPLNAILPGQGRSPWSKHSPSSGLEETFNGITMNGDSPGNVLYSPGMQLHGNAFALDGDSSTTPSTFTKGISSPPSTAPSIDGNPVLTVFPTSLKSRVETQIPIRMTLHPLPPGITKLKLPTHTISKPKFLAKPPPERSPEILELHTSLVCSSAMQDPEKLKRAFARARGDEMGATSKNSPASSAASESPKDEEGEKPLDGGEVTICSGCIQRERKRASRKKLKKPEEEQLFLRDEEKRVVVFNTNEIKEWTDQSKDPQKGNANTPAEVEESLPTGIMQVELPMRIACYCRHHNEKIGFQVIFSIKDHTDKVIAQAISNSIMITDDHKTHAPPPPVPSSAAGLPDGVQVPSKGVFPSTAPETPAGPQNNQNNANIFKQSFSTTDLQALHQNFSAPLQMASSSNPFAIPSTKSGTTSATLTPRNLSRPPSPGATSGPVSKRRKQSSGKVPSMLAMTRLDTQNAPAATTSTPTSAAPSQFPPNMTNYNAPSDRGFVMPNSRPGHFAPSPPTPNGNDSGFVPPVNRSFSMDNLSRSGMISAPNSRQPSRPNSPVSTRPSLSAADNQHTQTMPAQMFSTHARRPAPLIHKLVPAEGSILGGTEVTLLGNGFHQGLEVMFGDTEATTTTYWGEKCLNCITPPAIQPGTVTVVFKHEHPHFASVPGQSQPRQTVFTYVDDREVELYRLALKTLGKRLQNPTDDPYAAAQQLLGGSNQRMWGVQNNFSNAAGQQRQTGPVVSAFGDLTDLEASMAVVLDTFDQQGPYTVASLDLQRPSGHTLLHLASSLGMTRFVSALLARGADPNMLDNNGNTPMHLAAMFGHSHIVHRLRLAGGSNKIRSIRNFVPADLATSLLAHQASMLPNHHYRSRSAGGTPMRLHSRNNSTNSLKSFWESESINNSYIDSSDESDDGELRDGFTDLSVSGSPRVTRRRQSGPGDLARVTSNSLYSLSRQNSAQPTPPQAQLPNPGVPDQQHAFISPAAHMMAWRDQLAAQIQQYQQSVNWTLPNLPNLPALPSLPALPTMPDYQDHPMVRRVSSLFPHRAGSRPTSASNGREGWWESLTGSGNSSPSAPPAYDELFPDQDSEEEYQVKKASAVQAAGDAALDRHFEMLDTQTMAGSSSERPKPSPRSLATPQLPPGIRRHEVKRIRSDKNLFLIWIPLLVIVLGMMLRNAIPEAWRMFQEGREYFNEILGQQPVVIQAA